jgi:hypothetical protein
MHSHVLAAFMIVLIASDWIDAQIPMMSAHPYRKDVSNDLINQDTSSLCVLFSDCAGRPETTFEVKDEPEVKVADASWTALDSGSLSGTGLVQLPMYQPPEPKMDESQYFSRSFFRWLARKRARHHLKTAFQASLPQLSSQLMSPKRTTDPKEGLSDKSTGKSTKVNSQTSRRNRDFQTQGW